jgi:hypothetical protein
MREEELPKKLMAILVLMVLGITLPIAADAVQPPDKGTKSGTSYPVYVEIPVGDRFDEVTIAEFGPLEFFARCFLSDGSGPAAVVALELTSTVDDWLTDDDTTLRLADALAYQGGFSSESMLVKPFDISAAAVTTGHYLGFFGVVASPGMNIQNACVVAGQIDTAELPRPSFGRSEGGSARRSGAGDNPESSEPIADIGHESSPSVGALPVMWTWP